MILLNGLAGSSFNARLNNAVEPHWRCKTDSKNKWFSIWLSLHQLLPENIDCFFHNIVLQYNTSTKQYHNAMGVDIDGSVDWGNVGGIQYLDPGLKKVEYYYHLEIGFNTSSKLVSILNTVPSKKMFDKEYPYRASMSRTMLDSFK